MSDIHLVCNIVQVEAKAVLILGGMYLGIVERQLAFLLLAANAIERELAPIWTQRDRAADCQRTLSFGGFAFSLGFLLWCSVFPISSLFLTLVQRRRSFHKTHQIVIDINDLA